MSYLDFKIQTKMFQEFMFLYLENIQVILTKIK